MLEKHQVLIGLPHFIQVPAQRHLCRGASPDLFRTAAHQSLSSYTFCHPTYHHPLGYLIIIFSVLSSFLNCKLHDDRDVIWITVVIPHLQQERAQSGCSKICGIHYKSEGLF